MLLVISSIRNIGLVSMFSVMCVSDLCLLLGSMLRFCVVRWCVVLLWFRLVCLVSVLLIGEGDVMFGFVEDCVGLLLVCICVLFICSV